MAPRLPSTMLLLEGLLWISALPGTVTARPRPLRARQSVTLSDQSSCNDVANYQTENGLVRIQADMYDMLGAAGALDDYFFAEGNQGSGDVFTDYVSGYAAQ